MLQNGNACSSAAVIAREMRRQGWVERIARPSPLGQARWVSRKSSNQPTTSGDARRFASKNGCHPGPVDVLARQNHRCLAAAQSLALLDQGCERGSSSPLGSVMGVGEEDAGRLRNLVVDHLHHAL